MQFDCIPQSPHPSHTFSFINIFLFGSGNIDFFSENTSKDWATSYDIPAVQNGLIIKESIEHENPQGMQAFAFNTRKEFFKNKNDIFLLRFNYATKKIIYSISLCNSLRQEQTGPPSKPQNAGYYCILLHIAAYPAQATPIPLRVKTIFSCCD